MRFFKSSLLVLILSFFNSNAQQIIGKVVDNESHGLNEVIFTSKSINQEFISKENGEILLPSTGLYSISKKGYISSDIELTTLNYFIVTLKISTESLDEILIKGSHLKQKLFSVPSSVALLPKKYFNENTTKLAQIINTVPGVFMHSGTYTTNRITIRGIGSRNLYGTSKIKVYYDDIPLTNGSGESSIEDVELAALGSIEVHKGPASSIFGSGLGGAIQLVPIKGVFNENSINSRLELGSFGLKKYLLQAKLGNAINSANIVYSNFKSDGYRNNNSTTKESLTIASRHFTNNKNSFSFFGNYIDLKGFIPSSINVDDYINNPKTAAYSWEQAEGFESTKKGIIGLSWKHNFNQYTSQYTHLFYTNFDLYEARPFNILKEQTSGVGIRSKLNSKGSFLNTEFKWLIGGEFFNDKKSYATFKNLYKDNLGNDSLKGSKLSNWIEDRSYINIFLDSEIDLGNETQLSLGLNLNQTFFNLTDKFNLGLDNRSGKYNFDLKFSPSIGISKQLHKTSMLFGNISHGFSNPTLEEILLPNNKINSTIKPEEGWNFEIGSRGKLLNQKLNYSVSIFQMNVKNLLVAKRIGNNEYIGVNAGKTSYKGIELTLNHIIIENQSFKIDQNHNVSFNNFKFKDYVDFENNFSGNRLPGIPKFTFHSSINLISVTGIYGNLNYSYVGKMALRDDNILSSKKYQLVNTTVGYKLKLSDSFSAKLFILANNIFNEKYASMILINASSFGNSKPRYYYPGEPANINGGIFLNYTF